MSSIECRPATYSLTPKIRIQRASPVCSEGPKSTSFEEIKEAASSCAVVHLGRSIPTAANKTTGSQVSAKRKTTPTAEPESEQDSLPTPKMASRSRSDSPSNKSSSSSPPKRVKASTKDVDWSEVTDPEERRRIQNRIAQRRFREKAKEQKEKTERESRNRQHAGNSYRTPLATDFEAETELSGLPWGSVNLGHVLARGHEAESRRSSGRGTYLGEDGLGSGHYYSSISSGTGLHRQTDSFGSSGTEDTYFDDTSFVYDPSIMGQSYHPVSYET